MNPVHWRRGLVAGVVSLVALYGCGTGGGTSNQNTQLATDQSLRIPYANDVETLDPGHVEFGNDIALTNEMFDGLYKFDDQLKEVNDLATGPPDVSSDGLTYTFHMRTDAKFWNGDPITAKDVVYSWNRLAYFNDSYASCADPIQGSQDTENQKTKTMTGLTAPDDKTVVAKLSQPAGYWYTELGLWCMQVVDQKVTGDYSDPNNKQGDSWWQNPATAVGSGPYKLVQRTPKASMEFDAVQGWWGSPQPVIKKVMVTIGEDPTSQVKKYESGGYDLVGFGANSVSSEDILRYKSDATKKSQLTLYNAARTTWVSFNLTKGPFATKAGGVTPGQQTNGTGITDVGKAGRHALSTGVDRSALADVACAHAATCTPATGGWISKGLQGYLGDNSDPNAKFDATAAKSEYTQWDPDGSKARAMTFTYRSDIFTAAAQNLQAQWKQNLGITVNLQGTDKTTMSSARKKMDSWVMGYGSWGADYDHPQDWFDNMLICAQAKVGKGSQGMGYCNPALDQLVAKADTQPLTQALPSYQQAGKMLYDDMTLANLYYNVQPYLVQSYLKGACYNGLFDCNWEGMRILKH